MLLFSAVRWAYRDLQLEMSFQLRNSISVGHKHKPMGTGGSPENIKVSLSLSLMWGHRKRVPPPPKY